MKAVASYLNPLNVIKIIELYQYFPTKKNLPKRNS